MVFTNPIIHGAIFLVFLASMWPIVLRRLLYRKYNAFTSSLALACANYWYCTGFDKILYLHIGTWFIALSFTYLRLKIIFIHLIEVTYYYYFSVHSFCIYVSKTWHIHPDSYAYVYFLNLNQSIKKFNDFKSETRHRTSDRLIKLFVTLISKWPKCQQSYEAEQQKVDCLWCYIVSIPQICRDWDACVEWRLVTNAVATDKRDGPINTTQGNSCKLRALLEWSCRHTGECSVDVMEWRFEKGVSWTQSWWAFLRRCLRHLRSI